MGLQLAAVVQATGTWSTTTVEYNIQLIKTKTWTNAEKCSAEWSGTGADNFYVWENDNCFAFVAVFLLLFQAIIVADFLPAPFVPVSNATRIR